MSTSYCPQCNGSGFVRRGGMDHSGQVEWAEGCPNGCPAPPRAPWTMLEILGTVIGVIVIGGFFLAGWLNGVK